MPRPSRRTRSKKKIMTKTSGGHTGIHYRAKKFKIPCCSNCGQKLAGLPRLKPSSLSKLSGSQRKVERAYGGNLCHSCLIGLLRQESRNI